MKEDKERYLTARDGDHVMIPFQYDIYKFRNMQQRDPGYDRKDTVLLREIRRASPDAFWRRKSSTVAANCNGVMKFHKVSLDLCLNDIFPDMNPFSLEDNMVMGTAT